MKKTFYPNFVCFSLIFCTISCYSPVQQHGDVIKFDLTKTYSEQEYVLENIAEVNYLPLETRDDFLVAGTFAYMDAEQIIIKDQHYLRSQLFFFDRTTGTALSTLNRKGRGGNEYIRIDAFSCDKSAKEIFILDASQKTVLVYGFDHSFKRRFEVYKDCVEMIEYDNTSLLIYIEQDTISKPFLLISKENGQVMQTLDVTVGKRLNAMQAQIGKMVTEARMIGVSASLVSSDDGVLISDWACDTLYHFDFRGVLKPIAIRTPSAHEMKPCQRLHITGDNGRFVFFNSTLLPEMMNSRLIDSEHWRYAYDRQERKIVTPRFMLADDPTGAVWHGNQWGNQYGAYMMCELKAEKLYAAYRSGKLEGRLNEIAATIKEDDNPVLMTVKFHK